MNRYNLSDHELAHVLRRLGIIDTWESVNNRNFYPDVDDSQVMVIFKDEQTTTSMVMNKFEGYEIADPLNYLDKVTQNHYDLITVHAKRTVRQRMRATSYGNKLATSFKVFKNNRFYRVYTDVWSNVGVLYILEKGEKLYLH